MRGLEQRLRDLCPDYTVFFTIRPPTVARRYNLGVATMIRNDVGLHATKADIPTLVDWEAHGELAEHFTTAAQGRLLLVKTKPAGAAGAVWLLNVYQHADAGARKERKQVFFLCTVIAQKAAEEGAALVLAGDWNAAIDLGQRPTQKRRTRTSDTDLQAFVQEIQCRPAHGLQHGEYSWESAANVRHRADIDHLMVVPSSVAMSSRRFARPLNPSNDHCPIVVTLDHEVFGSPVPSLLDTPPETHRIRVGELDAHRHTVVAALDKWWETATLKQPPATKAELEDPESLRTRLHEASGIMAGIVGYTKGVKGKSRKAKQLPGHARLLRETDVLYHLRKAARHSEARCKEACDDGYSHIELNYWH